MSHAKERKEKNCLNCNAIVAGRFCQVCGQENIETHETFGHLAGHFIGDIFHFDGQFFSTAKYLLFRPGFLTREYVRGRRASYLNPIKMYFFVSAAFFLFFLNTYQSGLKVAEEKGQIRFDVEKSNTTAGVIAKLRSDSVELRGLMAANKLSSSYIRQRLTDKINEISTDIQILQKDSTRKMEIYNSEINPELFGENPYSSRKEYDSLQKTLPPAQRDGWLSRAAMYRNIDVAEKFRDNEREALNGMQESIFHHFPQVLFISLPLFALLLKLLYVRHKKVLYANHIIYTLHVYCALFVFLFILLLLSAAETLPYFSWIIWIQRAVLLYTTFYTFRALQVYYGQGVGKTLLKWFLLNSTAFVIMIVLLIAMFFFAIFTL